MSRYLTLALIVVGLAGLGLTLFATLHQTPPAATPVAAAAPAPPPPPVNRTVLVAAGPLRAGALLKPADITSKNPARHGRRGRCRGQQPASHRRPVRRHGAQEPGRRRADQPRAGVMRPGDPRLPGGGAATRHAGDDPGARTLINSQVDLVWPGDHVDLVLTQQIDANKAVCQLQTDLWQHRACPTCACWPWTSNWLRARRRTRQRRKPPPHGPPSSWRRTKRAGWRWRNGSASSPSPFTRPNRLLARSCPRRRNRPTRYGAGDVAPGLASETPTAAAQGRIRVWQGAADAQGVAVLRRALTACVAAAWCFIHAAAAQNPGSKRTC